MVETYELLLTKMCCWAEMGVREEFFHVANYPPTNLPIYQPTIYLPTYQPSTHLPTNQPSTYHLPTYLYLAMTPLR